MNGRKLLTLLMAVPALICFSIHSPAANLTSTTSEGTGSDWTAAIWQTNGGGAFVSASTGNTNTALTNGTGIGSNTGNTRVRTPTSGGTQTFPGDSLTLNTNTELRMKTPGTTANFPGVGGRPGLILNGGLLNAGDSGGFSISGLIQTMAGTTSYLCPGDNDANAVDGNRYINLIGQLAGSGNILLFEGGTSNPNQMLCSTNNFSGQWIIKCGWLQGAATNSLGTNNITVDPDCVLGSPPFDASISSAQSGPAVFEVNYNLNSAGVLTLTNGGQMKLHQSCAFNSVRVEGNSLSAGLHTYSQLNSSFPVNFPAGGSGSITVQAYSASPQILAQPGNQNVSAGQTVMLGVNAIGSPPLSYQWCAGATNSGIYANLTDSGNISGSISPTLTLSSVTPSNTASYQVVITNVFGSITSSVATLIVAQAPPAIVMQPASQTFYSGQTAQLAVNATGTPPLYYLWMASATNGSVYTNLADGGQISGSATTNLTISNLTLDNIANYIVVVTNFVGATTSSVATLIVAPAPPTSTNVLASALLRLQLVTYPFSFNVIEKSTGIVLLQQTANQFTIGNTYSVSFATNLVITSTTLDADLVLSGNSSIAHVTFSFIQPGILQTTLSDGNNLPGNIFQQFADQGEDTFGAMEVPYNADLSDRGISLQLIGAQGVANIDQGSGAHAPFYLTTRHYGIYVESQALGTMTFAQSGQTSFSFPVPQMTYDILYGTNYATIMSEFNNRTVPSFMPPLWAFDSSWWMQDAHSIDGHAPAYVTNAQGNIMDTADKLTNYQIHASSQFLNRPYGAACASTNEPGDGDWGTMTFDPSATGFPNPAQMISDLNGMGYYTMVWISDLCWCTLYDEAEANGWLFYPGTDNSTVNLQNPSAYNWFQTNLNVFVNMGITGYKIDRCDQGEDPGSLQNTNGILFQQLAYNGMATVYSSNFFDFARSASDIGRQYVSIWNGDTVCTFQGLQYSIISGLRAGIINFPMWGSDTGGYLIAGSKPTEELFDRWLEFSAYSTFMEVFIGGGRTPWYDFSTNFTSPTNIVAIAAAQAGAHHDLMPYSRSWLYQATQNGMPVMRPIMFGYPNDTNETSDITNCEFLFGPNILVAPVITTGATNRGVYLPADNWLDYNTKSNLYTGPVNITAAAPIQTIPLFVNQGAIIPRGDIWQGNNSWTSNWAPSLRIEFFPSEDTGSSFPYYTGNSVQSIVCTNQNHTLTIQFGSLGYAGNLQVYLESLGSIAGTVVSNGISLTAGSGYTYNPATHLLQVPFNGPTSLVVSNAGSLFSPLEAWRAANFGNPSDPAVAGDKANPAHDGIPNFLKYAFELNPLAVSTNGLPFESVVNNSGTNYLALTFQRATNATDCTFTVLVTTNLVEPLSQWQASSSYFGANIISNTASTTEVSRILSNGVETITVRDNVPINSAPLGFMTVGVSAQ